MVYIANWVIIYHLPPIKGTRKLHWHHDIFGFSLLPRYEVELGKKNPKVFQLRWCFGCFGDVHCSKQQSCLGSIWMFPKIGVPQNGWFIMENPIKLDDLGGKTTIFGNIHIDCSIYIQLLYYSDQYCNHIDVQDCFLSFVHAYAF